MKVITNKYNDVQLPYEPELLDWLQSNYPFSEYKVIEL